MDRRTLTVLVVAALAVLAIGFSAATLTSTVGPDGDDGPGQGQGGDDGGLPVINDSHEEPTSTGGPDTPEFLQQLLMVIGALAALGVFVYLALYRKQAAMMILVLVLAVMLLFALLQMFGSTPELDEEEELGLLPGEGDEGEDSGDEDGESALWNPSSLLIMGLFGLLLLGLLGVLRWRGPGEEVEGGDIDPEDDTAMLGAIAGRAADRIEDGESGEGADAENEVYRAWREMTTELDIESEETTTPREFQQRAVDSGMAPDDVRELTALFERVRYGGEDATVDREQRAVDVLRRIESTYGEDG